MFSPGARESRLSFNQANHSSDMHSNPLTINPSKKVIHNLKKIYENRISVHNFAGNIHITSQAKNNES